MPPPPPHTVSGTIPSFATHSLFPDDDDDLDDICPVCESECTCRKKSAPSSTPIPSASSTPSSLPSVSHPPNAAKRPLKIKFTLPPNLKGRKPLATHSTSTGAHLGSAAQHASSSRALPPAAAAAAAHAPKRRGRPPKAPAARQNTKKKLAADDMEYKARGTTGTSATVRKAYQPPQPVASTSSADLSDSTLSDYPTFVPAASESTHSSSSESSDSSIDSDSDAESHRIVRNDDAKQAHSSTKLLPSHVGHSKKRANHRWEIKPRKESVSAAEEEDDEPSSTESGESSEASSEDGDDEDDDDEEDAEADVEDVEGARLLAEADVDLDDEEETHSRIGVSFGGSGWSDEDEDESFDADLFFANLDSDSGASSPEAHYSSLNAFIDEDVELAASFSADEEDALCLMDLDPSVQLRRGDGAFEFGVDLDLDNLWEGQLLFADHGTHDGLGLSFGIQGPDEDEDMRSLSGSEATASWEGSNAETVMLQESDGDTTEDELIGSDGLPNPRAMMIFKWPSTISAINPLSTLSPSSEREPPVNASPTVRIALASISAQRRSPPPTPSPADILAGRISMEELEDIEMEKAEQERKVRRRRGSGIPLMGEFRVDDVHAVARTAVVGAGVEAPTFFPRPVRVSKPFEPSMQDIIPSEVCGTTSLYVYHF